MNNTPVALTPAGRWTVPFQDDGAWRAGIYRPEHTDPAAITEMEAHSCPELFVCMNGEMGLLLRNEDGERTVRLRPGEAIMVTDYHNGYAIDEGGYFLVVERTSFTTVYIDRASGAEVRRVVTGG